jgi:hypothetical protein
MGLYHRLSNAIVLFRPKPVEPHRSNSVLAWEAKKARRHAKPYFFT